jgi:hypothetical protein
VIDPSCDQFYFKQVELPKLSLYLARQFYVDREKHYGNHPG